MTRFGRLRRFWRTEAIDASLDARKALAKSGNGVRQLVYSPIHSVDSLVDLVKSLVNLVDSLVEPPIHLFDLQADRLKLTVDVLELAVYIDESLFEVPEPPIHITESLVHLGVDGAECREDGDEGGTDRPLQYPHLTGQPPLLSCVVESTEGFRLSRCGHEAFPVGTSCGYASIIARRPPSCAAGNCLFGSSS